MWMVASSISRPESMTSDTSRLSCSVNTSVGSPGAPDLTQINATQARVAASAPAAAAHQVSVLAMG
jgi:hypothetical protein